MYKIDKIQKENKRVEIVGKIISAILYIILIPIIIFNFTLIVKSFINPKETPDFLGYKSFVIVSGSMEPTIMTGDAILVKKVPQEEIKKGDIISFEQGGSNVTHRIVEITKEDNQIKYTTKGDNNNTEDKEKVVYEQIEGKYQLKINQFGIIIDIIKSKVTLMVLIFIIILMYLYKGNIENKKKKRKEKREKYEKEREKIL